MESCGCVAADVFRLGLTEAFLEEARLETPLRHPAQQYCILQLSVAPSKSIEWIFRLSPLPYFCLPLLFLASAIDPFLTHSYRHGGANRDVPARHL